MAGKRLVTAALAGALLFVTSAPRASAQVTQVRQVSTNDCEVRINGRKFANGGRATVSANRRAAIAVTALAEKPRYRVEMELADFRSTVGTGRGQDFGWRRDLDIPRYADYGVGTYRLRVITTIAGKPCTVTGLVDIKGRAPVTTLTGGLAALATLVGFFGLLLVLFRRGRPLRTRHGFGVDDPLGEFIAVDTPGNYVGWAEVACDLGARKFVTTKPSADVVRAFLREPKTHVRLAEIARGGARVKAGEETPVLPRLQWRPRLYLLAPVLGLVGALGLVTYLQQSAALYPTRATLAIAAGIGIVAGVIVANFSRLFAVVGLNRRLARAEVGLDEEVVEPRYPPIDHLDELDTFVWTPTHTVPDEGDGLPAWLDADRSKDSVATLDPGLPVRVVERRDGLAQVVCSNGWVGWTDAEQLQDIDS